MSTEDPFLPRDLRERIATAPGQPDHVVADVLAEGLGHALDLESEALTAARHVDELIHRGDAAAIAEAAARHRRVRLAIAGLRSELAELRATRRLRPAAEQQPLDPSPAAS